MKKTITAFLLMAMLILVSSSICFAEAGEDPQVYINEQIPVTSDREYPDRSFRTHSWITGTGSQAIAHTQLIDMSSGKIIHESSTNCNYVDPVYESGGN